MKLELSHYEDKFENFYYITLDAQDWYSSNGSFIADFLNLDFKKYNKILRKYRAVNKSNKMGCFHQKENGLLAIIELEKYLVMKQLI